MVACLLVASAACTEHPLPHEVEAPAARAVVGCDRPRDAQCGDDEPAARVVDVPRFFIDRAEVSQGDWRRCVDAGACPPASTACGASIDPSRWPRRPIACTTWDDAAAYCAWRGARLPTEIEWERAARGVDGRTYPWGDEPPDCARAAYVAGCEAPLDVDGRAASPIGARDMGGNVSEWTADAPTPATRLVKDSGYDAWHMRAAQRQALPRGYREAGLGFRCARTPRR